MSLMPLNISNFRQKPEEKFWTNQDIADFYRAVDILRNAGLNTEVDSGTTDEGDPWFVFIRPENGDVIAHFARVDGAFIAVSSLNNEIYKGRDIRGIVDQMLDRHPLLLPQSNAAGKFFLHPTAALSAFLAAAFILTIDGVKASSLTDVIGAVSPMLPSLVNSGPPILESPSRVDPFKGIFSELNGVNYNAAIHGAALIAHELSQNELIMDTRWETSQNPVEINNKETEIVEETQQSIAGGADNGRANTYNNKVKYSFNEIILASDAKETAKEVSNKEVTFSKGKDENVTVRNEPSSESAPAVIHGYEVLWDNGDIGFESGYGVIFHDADIDIKNEYGTIISLNKLSEMDTIDVKVSSFEKDIEDGVQILSAQSELSSEITSAGLGMLFDVSGQFMLFSLKTLDLSVENSRAEASSFSPFVVSEAKIEPLLQEQTAENIDMDNDKGPFVSLEANADEIIVPQTSPILGHSFSNPGKVLQLTDALDVVFYRGGNAEISDFELGKDLLWFILSPDELLSAENTVNDYGDLVLDFGDTGTLTFLGMIADPFVDVAL